MSDKSEFPDREVEYLKQRRKVGFQGRRSRVPKVECIRCGQPFDPIRAAASHLGLCDYCFDKH